MHATAEAHVPAKHSLHASAIFSVLIVQWNVGQHFQDSSWLQGTDLGLGMVSCSPVADP